MVHRDKTQKESTKTVVSTSSKLLGGSGRYSLPRLTLWKKGSGIFSTKDTHAFPKSVSDTPPIVGKAGTKG